MFYGLTTKRLAFLLYIILFAIAFGKLFAGFVIAFGKFARSQNYLHQRIYVFSLRGKLTRGLAFWTLFPAIEVRFGCSLNSPATMTVHLYNKSGRAAD